MHIAVAPRFAWPIPSLSPVGTITVHSHSYSAMFRRASTMFTIRINVQCCVKNRSCGLLVAFRDLPLKKGATTTSALLSTPLYQRTFSSFDSSTIDDQYSRNKSINMNPDGISGKILPPGDMIYKINKATGEKRKVLVEQYFGHFWMIKDLRENDGKPILSNLSLVPSDESQMLPPLDGLHALTGEEVSIPSLFVRNKKRASVTKPGCTLLAISFKQYGYELIPGWVDPFEKDLADGSNKDTTGDIEVYKVCITGGGFVYRLLKPFITHKFVSTTPEEKRPNILLYFGDPKKFRDALRMHNTLTAYVVLLDTSGRLRWMGSGKASDEEVQVLTDCARGLLQSDATNEARVGRKIRRR